MYLTPSLDQCFINVSTSEPPTGFVKQITETHPHSFLLGRCGVGQKMRISPKFPGDADVSGLGTTL